jgi:hypothetical protein
MPLDWPFMKLQIGARYSNATANVIRIARHLAIQVGER